MRPKDLETLRPKDLETLRPRNLATLRPLEVTYCTVPVLAFGRTQISRPTTVEV